MQHPQFAVPILAAAGLGAFFYGTLGEELATDISKLVNDGKVNPAIVTGAKIASGLGGSILASAFTGIGLHEFLG